MGPPCYMTGTCGKQQELSRTFLVRRRRTHSVRRGVVMSRTLLTIVLTLLSVTGASAVPPPVHRQVDLNRPDALERLRVSNPSHYAMVLRIVDGLTKRSSYDALHWIRGNFPARDVTYSLYVLTSYPPQRDLSLILDNTRYRARVTLTAGGAVVYPVKRSPW